MIVPERWLRSFCDPALDAEALAQQLTMAGLEVESCTPVAPPGSGVLVAQVLSVDKHPQADKLTVCKVNATYLASTWPDAVPREILLAGRRIYLVSGYEHE